MDLFKKGTLKSQSLNSRFLQSTNQPNQPRSHLLQPVKPPTPSPGLPSSQNSKLKLTTTRQSSSLRLNRDQTSSPGLNDTSQGTGKDGAAEKKAPVWNKGLPSAKPSKDYTDEELKAMHGISLVSRKSNTGAATKEGRWDDSDEDDDWGDTIDFGDGTKVTIGRGTSVEDPPESKAAPPARAATRPVREPPAFDTKVLGAPWKKSENLSVVGAPLADFPPVSTKPTSSTKVNGLPSQASVVEQGRSSGQGDPDSSLRSPPAPLDQAPSASMAYPKESRMQQSGDARYQYEQNTYDRHWQNPPPSTREIFNSTTGRFEQIEANQKPGRRPSHHERKSGEVVPRQIPSGDARRASNAMNTPTVFSASKEVHVRPPIATGTAIAAQDTKGAEEKSVVAPNSEDSSVPDSKPSQSPVPITVPSPKPLDPSSQEFIDMQKQLMAERREQAIQRRKDQEAEENARKERARKKAAELAALADKEKAEKEAEQKAKIEVPRTRPVIKLATREPAPVLDLPKAAPKATKEVAKPIAPVNTSTKPLKIESSGSVPSAHPKVASPRITIARSQFERRDPFDLSSPHAKDSGLSFDDTSKQVPKNDQASPSRNLWGPIGPRNASNTNLPKEPSRSEPVIGSFGLDSDLSLKDPGPSLPTSPPSRSGLTERLSSPSWSAFDGIAQSRRIVPSDVREYNVFDAADEVITPERHRNSPPGQSQANRTSSRFFPAASTHAHAPAPKTAAIAAPFISPSMPPRIDSVKNVHYEPLDTAPTLTLPASALDVTSSDNSVRRIDQVMLTIRSSMHPEQLNASHDYRQSRYGGRSWLDTQTRTVWEIKPLREGLSPKIRVPYIEKTLDWTRKERLPVTIARRAPDAFVNNQPAVGVVAETTSAPSAAHPTVPAWSLPKDLETTSKVNSIVDPLIPPAPSLKLPQVTDDSILERPLTKKSKYSKSEQEKVSKFYTTRLALAENIDHTSPIRIKTTEAEAQVSRRFGKRLDNLAIQKKTSDVKRQPVNMSDAPGGSGFKRGFANRVRATETAAPKSSSPAPPVTAHSITQLANGASELKSGPGKNTSTSSPTTTGSQDLRTGTAHASQGTQVHHPQPRSSPLPHQASQGFPANRESPQPQQFIHSTQRPMTSNAVSSRAAPPGLSIMKHDDPQTQNGASSAPTLASRGPPGIVLP